MEQISALGSQLGLLRDAALAHQRAPGGFASEAETSEWMVLFSQFADVASIREYDPDWIRPPPPVDPSISDPGGRYPTAIVTLHAVNQGRLGELLMPEWEYAHCLLMFWAHWRDEEEEDGTRLRRFKRAFFLRASLGLWSGGGGDPALARDGANAHRHRTLPLQADQRTRQKEADEATAWNQQQEQGQQGSSSSSSSALVGQARQIPKRKHVAMEEILEEEPAPKHRATEPALRLGARRH